MQKYVIPSHNILTHQFEPKNTLTVPFASIATSPEGRIYLVFTRPALNNKIPLIVFTSAAVIELNLPIVKNIYDMS